MAERKHERATGYGNNSPAVASCWSSRHLNGSHQAVRRLDEEGSPP
jgi:hypothetical protein